MSYIDAEETVNAVRYQQLRLDLGDRGISDYQIDLIETAMERHSMHDGIKLGYEICDHTYDSRGELQWAINLKRHHIVGVSGSTYWLTSVGVRLREELLALKPKDTAPKINLPVVVEDQMDISLARDGLMTTASKLWYVWTHRDEIKAARDKKWLEGFQNGQKEIDEAITKILEPREPIVLKPEPKVNPYWSETQQRKNNDLYWMTPDAFWLNPKGVLAPPTPAPDWWTVPENYQPKVYVPLSVDELVDKSLLAPPTANPLGITSATPEEIAAKYRQKDREQVLDELIFELDRLGDDNENDYEEYEYSIMKNFDHHDLVMVEYNNEVAGFPTAREANLWLAAKKKADRLSREEEAVKENKRQQRIAQDKLLQAAKDKVRGRPTNNGFDWQVSNYSSSSYLYEDTSSSYDSSGSSSDW